MINRLAENVVDRIPDARMRMIGAVTPPPEQMVARVASILMPSKHDVPVVGGDF